VKQLVVEAEKERDELKAKLFSAEHLADASVVLLEQLECARKVNESISAKWGEAEAKLAEALEDARAARRERDEAVRVREEMDTDAQHRAERYCHEKTLVARERDALRAQLAEVGEVLEGVWAKVVFTDTTLRKKVRALLKRGGA
jgi:predicted phage gp36 major capsid-like protein